MPPPDNTPALCRKLAQLLTVWQQIEAGKNPVWDCLRTIPEVNAEASTHYLQGYLGNLKDDVNPLLKELRAFNLITTRLAGVGYGRLHSINPKTETLVSDFVGNAHGKYFEPEGTRETTISTLKKTIFFKNISRFALLGMWVSIAVAVAIAYRKRMREGRFTNAEA